MKEKVLLIFFLCIEVMCGDIDKKESNSIEKSQGIETSPSIIFLGDSLTESYGLPENESLTYLFQAKLKEGKKNYKVINAGRSGDTTAGALGRCDWYLKDELRPKFFIVGIGSNDAMRGFPIEEIEKNLLAIISKIQKFDPKIKIFLWELRTFPNMGQEYTNTYTKLFSKVAKKKNIFLLPFPLEGVAGIPAMNLADGIHPNAKGVQVIANNIWKEVSPHLKN